MRDLSVSSVREVNSPSGYRVNLLFVIVVVWLFLLDRFICHVSDVNDRIGRPGQWRCGRHDHAAQSIRTGRGRGPDRTGHGGHGRGWGRVVVVDGDNGEVVGLLLPLGVLPLLILEPGSLRFFKLFF